MDGEEVEKEDEVCEIDLGHASILFRPTWARPKPAQDPDLEGAIPEEGHRQNRIIEAQIFDHPVYKTKSDVVDREDHRSQTLM